MTAPIKNHAYYTEYAATWGCDPVYDHAPNEKGDGYLFYNFNVEGYNPEFRAKFIPAIERTIKGCTRKAERKRLTELLDYVRAMMVQVYECGCCDCYHLCGFTGDCRDDANRFTTAQLDERFGPCGWEVFDDSEDENDNLEPDDFDEESDQ